jgi:hypothetical protein
MATCPNCGGHLTTHHRCIRSKPREIAEAVGAGLLGGLTAWLATAVFDRFGQLEAYDGAIFLGGVVLGVGAHLALRRRL